MVQARSVPARAWLGKKGGASLSSFVIDRDKWMLLIASW